jgi:predicted AAA+ superfamily ATPase
VERYIDIFEQSYIIFRVYPYSKNKRDELGKMPKIYFHDLGLRNALIDDFNISNLRLDFGAVFENFIMSELQKAISYQQSDLKLNYWRSRSGAEMDVVLSSSVKLYAVEVKWQERRISTVFLDRYPHAQVKVISKNNFY